MSTVLSRNPMLTDEAFSPRSAWGNLERDAARANTMTVQGTVTATAILLGIVTATATLVWSFLPGTVWLWPATLVGSLLGCVLGWIAYFSPRSSPFLAVPIAMCEGALAGGLSVFWSMYVEHKVAIGSTGIVAGLGTGLLLQAILLTVGIAAGLLILYGTGVIRVGNAFITATIAATFGLCFVSLAALLLSLCGIHIPYLWDNGPIGIGFAGFVVVLASMNLLVDFEFVRRGADNGLPRHMEWYSAIGIIVTLVWLYISILRLLAMLSRRN
jgi:uncharacterized YccA/Bax inhibitor family protein